METIEANSYSSKQVEQVEQLDAEKVDKILNNPSSREQIQQFPDKLKTLSEADRRAFIKWIEDDVTLAMDALSNLGINNTEDKESKNETSEIFPDDIEKIKNYLFVKDNEGFLPVVIREDFHQAEEREYSKLNKNVQEAIKWETGKEKDFATSGLSKIES